MCSGCNVANLWLSWGGVYQLGVADMPRIFALLTVLVGSWGLSAAAVEAAPPPLEAFGKRPMISDVKMSPGGTHYAALQWIQGQAVLVIYSPFSKDPAERVRMLALDASKRTEEKVEQISWLNDETVGLVFEFEAMRGGLVPAMGTVPTLETRLVAVRADMSDIRQIPRQPKAALMLGQLQHEIVDYLESDPDRILMALDRTGYGQTLNVYDVVLSNGGASTRTKGDEKIAWYMTDQQERVRMRASYTDKHVQIQFREPGRSSWNVLFKEKRADGLDYWPVTFASDPNRLLVSHTPKSGYDEILEYDLVTKSIVGPAYAPSGVGIRGVAQDRYTRKVTGYYYADDYQKIHYTDPELQALQKAIDKALPDTQNRISSYDRKRSMFIIFAGGPKDPGTYYMYLKDRKQLAKILDRNAIAVSSLDLGDMKSITYTARDGTQIPGYLTTPPHGAAPYPLIVMPHGGPTARDYLAWDHWVQFLASRGYAVLQPNFRGSSGYGGDFEAAGYGQWGLLMQDDVTDGAKAMIEQGIADPNRMCIVGGSYGGYAALMGAIVTPDLFQCAVSFAGVTDIPRMLAEGRRYKFASNNPPNVGNRFDDHGQLRDTSPINGVDAIKIPILLIHGDKDLSVDVSHSERMAKALKKAKKPHKLVIFKDGNHYHQLEKHRISFLRELEAFLDEQIGG